MQVNENDKDKVLSWLMKYASGFRNARTRQDVLPYVGFEDRYYRAICSQLKHEGHVASTCSRGTWAIPLCTKDPAEVEAALESYIEMKSKALDMLTGLDRQIKSLEDKKRCITQQAVMTF